MRARGAACPAQPKPRHCPSGYADRACSCAGAGSGSRRSCTRPDCASCRGSAARSVASGRAGATYGKRADTGSVSTSLDLLQRPIPHSESAAVEAVTSEVHPALAPGLRIPVVHHVRLAEPLAAGSRDSANDAAPDLGCVQPLRLLCVAHLFFPLQKRLRFTTGGGLCFSFCWSHHCCQVITGTMLTRLQQDGHRACSPASLLQNV